MSLLLEQKLRAVTVKAPIAIANGTAVYSSPINAGKCSQVEFVISFGAIVGDTMVITVLEQTTATVSGGTAVPFRYRLSAAAGTDTWGAVTVVSTGATGVTLTNSTNDNMTLVIDINPAELDDGYPYIGICFDGGASTSATVVGAIALCEPKYPEKTPLTLHT